MVTYKMYSIFIDGAPTKCVYVNLCGGRSWVRDLDGVDGGAAGAGGAYPPLPLPLVIRLPQTWTTQPR